MIGIVVVSHSAALAEAVVDLVTGLVPGAGSGMQPRIAVAAGAAGALGTDATAVAAAIEEVDAPHGVLVLYDLGSALLSTELALELIDPDLASRVQISCAPLVEGLFAAMISAGATGIPDPLEAARSQAEQAAAAKCAGAGFST
ncbi:MAG: PTS-dependent dihydroxyacetone kinase phosphotransferase subunit DhaM [Actinomycetales bacterium]